MDEFVYNEETAAVFNELFQVWRSSLRTEAKSSHRAALVCCRICNRCLLSLQRKIRPSVCIVEMQELGDVEQSGFQFSFLLSAC